MSNGTVQRANDPSGKLIDCELVIVDGQPVLRQRTEVSGSDPDAIADVVNADAPVGGSGIYGLAIRVVGRVPVEYCNGELVTSVVAINSLTPTALPAVSASNRRFIQVYNQGGSPIVIGGSTVVSAGGIQIDAGAASEMLPLGPNAVLYAASLAPTASILVLEITDA